MKKQKKVIIGVLFIVVSILCTGAFAKFTQKSEEVISFKGTTPSDTMINRILQIPREVKPEFITWHLQLISSENDGPDFHLELVYGESKPNTLGFIDGGTQMVIGGRYWVTRDMDGYNRVIYHLKIRQSASEILLAEINGSILQLLTPQQSLMAGNGGWSYTLNRFPSTPVSPIADQFKSFRPDVRTESKLQRIYVGRTPCQEMAESYGWKVSQDCFKLKWKLRLNVDPETLQPSTYVLQRTGRRDKDIVGNWRVIKGIPANPNVLIYQLDPDRPNKSINLLIGDGNVLFFLDKRFRHLVGDNDFSYTLNLDG